MIRTAHALAALAAASTLLSAATAQALVVYQNDFANGNTAPAFALSSSSFDASGGPGGSPALHMSDTATGSGGSILLAFGTSGLPTFSTANSGTNTLKISADYAVTSLSNDPVNSNSIPRMRLTNVAAAGGSDLFIGFGQNLSGTLVLFAARGNNPTPSSNPVLFDYGAYDSTTAANNDTNGYVRVTIEYTDQATTALVTATLGAVTTSTTLTGITPTTYSNTANQSFSILGGNTSLNESFLDNVTIEAVPEPASAGLLLVGAMGLLRRARRAK